ncbi:potassium channel family protein [Roseomonas cutis]|uniref:potassium channel family protein n=1 Tax=Roseomonas cutis TaxID=2897332 RepID=UPI002729A068|nr:potassium channel family protein [Roseomonas sp. OT10]
MIPPGGTLRAEALAAPPLPGEEPGRRGGWAAARRRLRELYYGSSEAAHRFRYALVGLDAVTVAFIATTSFLPRNAVVQVADVLLGLVLLAEFAARLAAGTRPWRDLLRPLNLADLVAVACFLIPLAGEGAAFLRALRLLRMLRSYQLVRRLRGDVPVFRRHEEAIVASADLLVFIFVMTGLVYETQHRTNPAIGNYADALYFTVTALTTTGFGDITLPGTGGRMLTVAIMFCGVTLFLRLAQTMFRPSKVRFPCPRCGLQRHEPDAVHCKACGEVLRIPDDGE